MGIINDKLETWQCPYCHNFATIRDGDVQDIKKVLNGVVSTNNNIGIHVRAVTCPNPKCKQVNLWMNLCPTFLVGHGYEINTLKSLRSWQLLPSSNVKPFPKCIPEQLIQDYEEACAVLYSSPKSSATLARRCLQGVIRDFYGICKKNLRDEIYALQGEIDVDLWEAFDGVRKIGNIGAHMEEDVNIILDIEPHEAKYLIFLIEILFQETYVRKKQRQGKLNEIPLIAKAKDEERKELRENAE